MTIGAQLLDLPDEVILKIFDHLSVRETLRLEATCRRLYLISERHWERLTCLDLLGFLSSNSRNLLDICSAYKFDMAAKSVIERVGPNLKHLVLSRFGPLEYGLRMGLEYAVVEHCGRLESLNLSYRLLERFWFIQLAEATSALKKLNVAQVHIRHHGGLDDKLLETVLKYWNKLESLIVRNNKLIHLACYQSLPITLRQLDVKGCAINSAFLAHALRRCPNLDTLSISYHPDTPLLQPFLYGEQQLKRLSIDCPTAFALPHWLVTSLENLTGLRSLTICSHLVNDTMFAVIGRCLVNLEELSLPGSRPGSLRSVEQALLELKHLPNLCRLAVKGNPIGPTLLRVCGRLERVSHVDVSYAVKQHDMANIFNDIRSQVLRTLVMKGFCPITGDQTRLRDELISRLKPNCPSLENVILS
uniref:F-box domain-containing protein n=1 Tax=Trichuris muris TaxID=70415 RepID=A0A5S6QVA5_TRIMR